VIGDDGVGFDVKAVRAAGPTTATLGLRGMEERAQALGGTLTIDSAATLGTQLCASFPLSASEFQVEPQRYESHSYSHS
jgi:signal transduction histidine kinase